MSIGDIRVVGLVMGTHVLEDIGMDVPHGITVTIPAAKACVSKDLWRAISQRCIFQLQSGAPSAVPKVADTSEADGLREQVRLLLAENARLKTALAVKEEAAQAKLDTILALLQAGGRPQPIGVAKVSTPDLGVVSGEVPTFIPSQIKPDNVEVQIVPASMESLGQGVSEAASALRKFRRNPDQ